MGDPLDEIFTDGYSKILTAVYYTQCMSMDLVDGVDYLSPVWVNPDFSTFLLVELHLSHSFSSPQS